jgi:hypothetical protein
MLLPAQQRHARKPQKLRHCRWHGTCNCKVTTTSKGKT